LTIIPILRERSERRIFSLSRFFIRQGGFRMTEPIYFRGVHHPFPTSQDCRGSCQSEFISRKHKTKSRRQTAASRLGGFTPCSIRREAGHKNILNLIVIVKCYHHRYAGIGSQNLSFCLYAFQNIGCCNECRFRSRIGFQRIL
jgi:hypothetical protein